MNEALKPDEVTQRSAPAPVETAPKRRRSLLVRIAIVAALAVAAVFAWQKFERSEPSTQDDESSGRHAQPPQTVRVAPVTLGDMPLTIDALGTVTPFETVTVKHPDRRQPAGQSASPRARSSRPATSSPRSIRAPMRRRWPRRRANWPRTQALLGQAQGDLSRFQQLAKQDSIAHAAGRRPGGAGRAGQGRDRHRSGDGQDGRAQRRLHPYCLAGHRTSGPEAGRPRQLSAALRRHRHRRHHPDRPDQRRVHDAGGQSAAHLRAAQFRRRAQGHGARPRQCPARSRPAR